MNVSILNIQQQQKLTPFGRPDDGYDNLRRKIQETFENSAGYGKPLFTTTADNLFDVFLENIPEEARQHYTCNACRHFVNRFGGLVKIDENGNMTSALWGDVPPFFKASVDAMKNVINRSKINGVFLSGEKVLGTPTTGTWHHMSVVLPESAIFREGYDQASACGIRLQYGQEWNAEFRVNTGESELMYKLDRWD